MDPVTPTPIAAPVTAAPSTVETNTSGMGDKSIVPEGIKGWSWGAFFWNWIWAIGNNTWIGLLALIPLPLMGFIMGIVLGINGREWAWKNKKWESVEAFNKTQQKWVRWWFIINIPLSILAIIGLILSLTLTAINPQKQLQLSVCTKACESANNIQSCMLECQDNVEVNAPAFPTK